MYSLGGLMAVPFVPSFSQLLGRRLSIAMGSFIMFLGAGLQAGALNQDMFLASRWVLGFGIPFAIVNASSLIGELSYERERPVMTSLFNASWFVGAIVAAGTTYGTFQMASTWSWRLPSLLQLVPSLCQVTFLPFCPESPRWLVSRDRSDEAFAILSKYHGEGDHGEEFVRLEFAQIQSTIALEKETSKSFVWANVFRDAPMRRRFCKFSKIMLMPHTVFEINMIPAGLRGRGGTSQADLLCLKQYSPSPSASLLSGAATVSCLST